MGLGNLVGMYRIHQFIGLVIITLGILKTILASMARIVGRLLKLVAVELTTNYSFRCELRSHVTG
jgi:predicted ferric reductase